MARIENLGEFLRGLEDDKEAVEKAVSMVTRRLSMGILSRIVLASPVDTGHFRGNWQVDIGRDPEDELPDLDKSGTATISRGTAVVAGAPPFETIYIVNNLPYGPKLNDGHSKQAPAGFVEAAVDAEVDVFA